MFWRTHSRHRLICARNKTKNGSSLSLWQRISLYYFEQKAKHTFLNRNYCPIRHPASPYVIRYKQQSLICVTYITPYDGDIYNTFRVLIYSSRCQSARAKQTKAIWFSLEIIARDEFTACTVVMCGTLYTEGENWSNNLLDSRYATKAVALCVYSSTWSSNVQASDTKEQ